MPGNGGGRPAGLRRFVDRPRVSVDQCEMCTGPIEDVHRHVVDLQVRSIMCVCRACGLLFTAEGAGGGRFRTTPERYLHDPDPPITEATWEALQIPVRLAFFFHNSDQERLVALYPSPAGATESLLPLDALAEVAGDFDLVSELAPDVEGLILARTPDGFEAFLAPIDTCYELVGKIRVHWRGFDGGADVHRRIDEHLDLLRTRAGAGR